MKRRKGVTILGALCTAFVILAGAAFAVIMLVLAPMFAKEASEAKVIGEAFNFLARNKDILGAFTTFDKNDLVPNVAVFSSIGLFVIISVIWLIVDLRRDRKICFFFIILFLLATYLELIYYFAITPLQEFITKYAEKYPLLLVPVGCAALAGLASILAIALFIVDIATGRVERPETPTFIKEPTEEVNETPYEEVKDESEVEEAPVAPAPIEEAPVEEEAEEVEEEKEEEKVVEPQRKTAPKKVKKPQPAPKKPAPAKKAEPKKEPVKKAEAKKEAPKAEPKKDARKTQTIVLQNEDGNSYAKAYHVSRRPELNKWQVKATGSDKALKLFNTQKEAIEYADQLAKNQNVSIRVHSKEGKIRKHNG